LLARNTIFTSSPINVVAGLTPAGSLSASPNLRKFFLSATARGNLTLSIFKIFVIFELNRKNNRNIKTLIRV
jgi:hypothetical protein